MTDTHDEHARDHMSADPAVRAAAIAREEAVLEAWPPADDQLTQLKRGVALANIGQALFRSHRMEDAADRLHEADRCLMSVSGLERKRANALNTRAAALLWLQRHQEARDSATRTIQLAKQADIPELLQTAWVTRSLASEALKDWPEATYAADELLVLLGADPPAKLSFVARRALVTKARAAREAGDSVLGLQSAEQAIAQSRKADLGADEPLCHAMLVRAELLHDAGDTTAAIAACDELIETYRDSPEDYALTARSAARGLRFRWKTGARFRGAFKKRGLQN